MSAVTIDELQVRINGSSTNAYASVDSLIGALEKLQHIRLDGGIAQSIENIGKAASRATSKVSKMAQAFADGAKYAVDFQRSFAWDYTPNWSTRGTRQGFETPWWQIAQDKGTDIIPYQYDNTDSMGAIDAEWRDVTDIGEVNLRNFLGLDTPLLTMTHHMVTGTQTAVGFIEGTSEAVGRLISRTSQAEQPSMSFGEKLEIIASKAELLKPVLWKIGEGLSSLGKSALNTAGKLITMPFKAMANRIEGTVKSCKQLLSSFKRIAMYRLLRSVIKEITEGFTEGIKAVSRYSRSIGGEFAQAMDSMSSQLSMMKGAIGAMAVPLLEMLEPAVEAVTNAVIYLVNALNQLFSILGGKNSWIEVTSAVKKYDDTVSGASNSQKKLTAGMDELNVLSENSGGGSSTASYVFETQELEAWAQTLKDLFENSQFYEFGKGIANLLNEAIEDWDAKAWGRKLGEKVQHAIEISYGFWKNLDTKTLGTKIGDFLNNAIDEIDTYMLGETFGEKWNRVVDLVYGFVTTFEWTTFATKITDWFKGALDAFNVQNLSDTVTSLVSGILGFVSTTVETFPLTDMVNAFLEFFRNIDWFKLGTDVGNLASDLVTKVVSTITDLLQNHDITSTALAIAQFIGGAIEGVNWKLIGLYISKLVWVVCQDIDSMLAWGIPAAVEAAITKSDFNEVMTRYMEDSAKDGWTLIYDATDTAIKDIDGLIETELQNETEKIKEGSAEAASQVGEAASKISESMSTATRKVYDASTGTFRDAITSVKTNLEDMKTTADKNVNSTKETITTSWADIKATTASDWEEIQKKVETTWDQLDEKATEKFDSIKKTITDKWQEILEDTTNKWGTTGTITSGIHEGLVKIDNGFVSLKDAIDTNLGLAYTSIENFVRNSIDRFNELIDKLNEYNDVKASGTESISVSAYEGSRGVKGYASGGVVSSGQMFVARESGAELVGSIGGHTAVMNNDQIVSAVAGGVYDAVLSAMSQSNGGNQSIHLYLDGKQIEASTRSTKQRRGASIATGGVYNFA